MGTTRSLEGYANEKFTFFGRGGGEREGIGREGTLVLSLSGGSKSL